MTTQVIYHRNCPDGFGAAWAVFMAIGYGNPEKGGVAYRSWAYGEPAPGVGGDDVIIVDFSFERDVMQAMIVDAKSLLCLDHHKTAEESLRGLPGCHFDMNRSGASMAWDWFHGDATGRPWLIDYLEDRDLWRWRLPESRAVSAWVMAQPHDFEAWSDLSEEDLADVIMKGKAIRKHIGHYCEKMNNEFRYGSIGGIRMLIGNAPMFNVSDLLDYVIEHERLSQGVSVPACAWWLRGDGVYQYSLRSRGEFDVAEIAKTMGGGGHRNAAGFQANRLVFEMEH